MPGRLLGSSKNCVQRSTQDRPRESKSKSAVVTGRERRYDRTREDAGTQGRSWSPRGLEAAAASLHLDRDSQEERRAWAQRARAGRVAAAVTPEKREGAYSSNMRGGKESQQDEGSDIRNGRLRQARPRSANYSTLHFDSGRRFRSTTSTVIQDPVSRAFETYAMARDRDTNHRSLESHLTSSTPATEAERSIQLGSSIPLSREWPRQQNPEPPSETETHRLHNGGVSKFQSSEGQTTGLTPSLDESLANGRGERDRLFGPTISAPRWRQRDRDNSTAMQSANGEKNDIHVRDGIVEQDQGEAINEPEQQRALRRAFDAYDINGDGFITYLEVRTCSRWLISRC